MKLEVHPNARAEARASHDWYREHDEDFAKLFQEELKSAFLQILEAPLRSPPYMHGMRRVLFRRLKHQVVYQILPDMLLVLAIAHQRRSPGYWARRIRG